MSTNSLISYATVLTFPKEVENELASLRNKYNKYVTYSIAPHITLKQPFILRVDLKVVDERLRIVANRTKPFVLIHEGVEYFEGSNNAAYIAIKNKEPVRDLHVDIVHSLKGLVEMEYKENYELDQFMPHMTIAELIPNEVLVAIKKELSNCKANHRVRMDSFTLYAQGEGRVWKPKTIFRFSGK